MNSFIYIDVQEMLEKTTEDRIDDVSYIHKMAKLPGDENTWPQYDILLLSQRYGWDYALDWADYMACTDLHNVTHAMMGGLDGEGYDISDSYISHGGRCATTPELQSEAAWMAIGGISEELNVPIKIVWLNQTKVLRFMTPLEDDWKLIKYAETMARRTFGTADSMKPAKPIPKEQ